jgi:phospholipase D-like protein
MSEREAPRRDEMCRAFLVSQRSCRGLLGTREIELANGMTTILLTMVGLYVLAMGVFLISENRRPQATLAWLLVFFFAPSVGVLIYILFGRDRKAFSKQSRLLKQDLEPTAVPLLSPLLSQQDAELARLKDESPSHRKLMVLVRRNSRSALARRNLVEIQQNAAVFYPSTVEDMKAARHSIHLHYFIWRADLSILLDLHTRSRRLRRVFAKVGFHSGFALRVRIQPAVRIRHQVDLPDTPIPSAHLILLNRSLCGRPSCRIRSASRPRNSRERKVPSGMPSVQAASS